ncbi:MAG: molybdenum cofactor biosynthesis protein MoaE [Candidatus Bathyarchaeia archaeon]
MLEEATMRSGVHQKGEFSLQKAIDTIKAKKTFCNAGAIAVFIGVVRGKTLENKKVQKLRLEAYEEKANEVLEKICRELKKKKGIVDVQIHHLLGEFGVGNDLVYVIVAGSHRQEVFPVLEQAVERYKKEAPIFKKEYVFEGKNEIRSYWVSERIAK